jgi:DNA-binding GntR family transcriptional regulator
MSLEDRSRRIDRSRPVLLYEQVAADLRADITSGRITGRLPGEFELAEQYGVSRVTVRTAVEVLMAEGLLVRLRGRGTYVAERT